MSTRSHNPNQTNAFPSLLHSTWQPLLDKAEQASGEEKLALLSEAIRTSAHFHPLFHFFESGLNTELAILYHHNQQPDLAAACAKRALFLDHDNDTAKHILSGKQGGMPIYDKSINKPTDWLPTGATSSDADLIAKDHQAFALASSARQLAEQGDVDAAIKAYLEAIEQTEQAHQAYHLAAAKPWLLRAEYFRMQGEEALAKNDLVKARDLDPTI